MHEVDVTIVGGGIVGCAIADAAARAGLGVVLLERESSLAAGTTSRNSQVAHGGMYYPAGTLKARCCVGGRRLLKTFCAESGVAYLEIGKLIVATGEAQLSELERLRDLGRENEVEGLEMIDAARLAELEPEITGLAALHSPATGILDAEGVARAMAARATEHAAQVLTDAEITALDPGPDGWRVRVDRHGGESWTHRSARVVVAAGLHADAVAELTGLDVSVAGLSQEWVKGSYFSVAPRHAGRVRRLVYPVPDPGLDTLGVHVCLDLDGQIKLGPDYEPVDRVEDYAVDPMRGDAFFESARSFLPFLERDDLRPAMCGLRPKLAPHGPFSDFRILRGDGELAGLTCLAGIDSPGLTSAPALGEIVSDLLHDRDVAGVS